MNNLALELKGTCLVILRTVLYYKEGKLVRDLICSTKERVKALKDIGLVTLVRPLNSLVSNLYRISFSNLFPSRHGYMGWLT